MCRFLYGRNGVDALSWALVVAELTLTFLAAILRVPAISTVCRVLSAVLWLLVFYRILSRDLVRRRAENAKFLAWWQPKAQTLRGFRDRRRDTAHRYAHCRCGAYLRVPRGVGTVEATCPKCGRKKKIKT